MRYTLDMMLNRPWIDDFAVRTAALYAALFMQVGIHMLAFPVWLSAKGLDPEAIALVLAVSIVVRVVAVPILSRLADRFAAFRGMLIASAAMGTLGLIAVGLGEGFAGIMVTYALASVPLAPIGPLSDAYALKGLSARGRAFGPVRVWGSVAYVAGNLAAGLIMAMTSPAALVWFLVLAEALIVAAAAALRPLEQDAREDHRGGPADRTLLRSPRFLAIAAAACLIQASHALYYGFSAIDWSRKGLSGPTVGGLWAVGVVAEIVLFALSPRLPPRLDPLMLLGLGAAGAVVRWSAMALDPPTWLLPLLQCLHALSFGATFLGSVQFVSRIAGERRFAAAQGDLSTISSAGMAVITVLSGMLYTNFGTHGYAAMALIAATGGGCALLANRVGSR